MGIQEVTCRSAYLQFQKPYLGHALKKKTYLTALAMCSYREPESSQFLVLPSKYISSHCISYKIGVGSTDFPHTVSFGPKQWYLVM